MTPEDPQPTQVELIGISFFIVAMILMIAMVAHIIAR